MLDRKIKKKKCKNPSCKRFEGMFTPQRIGQKCCGPDCAYQYTKLIKDKETTKLWYQTKKVWKDELKTNEDWLGECRYWFNRFIRLRDKDYPCISCGTCKTHIAYDAGHFWAAGNYSFLRFHEDNVHKQCSFSCNKKKSGNLGEYRINLIKKIGPERVQWLDDNRHLPFVFNLDEVKDKIKYYKQKCKELEAA